jgi:hypothetical protein
LAFRSSEAALKRGGSAAPCAEQRGVRKRTISERRVRKVVLVTEQFAPMIGFGPGSATAVAGFSFLIA